MELKNLSAEIEKLDIKSMDDIDLELLVMKMNSILKVLATEIVRRGYSFEGDEEYRQERG